MNVKTAFIIVFCFFLFAPQSAIAIESGGIGGKPAYPRYDTPQTESIFMHTLAPGTSQTDGVTVINNTSSQKTLSVYAADSTPSSGGGFACKQLSERKTDVGTWITLEQNEVTLESNTNVIVPFTITVPQPVDVGEHNGCILIQEVKPNIENQKGINLAFRSGMRVAIIIPGEIVRKLEIVDFTSAKNKKGLIVLTPKVKNLGNISVSTDISIITHSILGKNILQQKDKIEVNYLVLRNDISEWNFELKPLFWGGWYRSELSVAYDNKQMTASLVFFSWPTPKGLAIEIAVPLLLLLIVYLIFIIITKKIRFQIISTKNPK